MKVPKKPRITISKTPSEWENINHHLKKLTKNDIHGYVNNEVEKVVKTFISNPENVRESGGEKKKIEFVIKPSTYIVLKEISKKMERPINSFIDEIIILPLLRTKS